MLPCLSVCGGALVLCCDDVIYKFNAHGNDVESVQHNDGCANFGICAPAALKITVPFSNATNISLYVIRASSNDSPRGCDTSVICFN